MIKKIIILCSLITSPFVQAFGEGGEYLNIAAGAAFGAGYKKIAQSQPALIAVPLTTLAVLAEFCAVAIITGKSLDKNKIHNQNTRNEIMGGNFLLIYATSIGTALALYGIDRHRAEPKKEDATVIKLS